MSYSSIENLFNDFHFVSNFRIEKQNLVRFPEDPKPLNIQRTDTQRILDEIEKINIKLGYKKYPKPTLIQNPNQYLYPKPSYNSFGFGLLGGGGKLEPSIRSLNMNTRPRPRAQFNNFYKIPLHLPRMSKKSYLKSSNASVIQTKGYKIVGLFDKNNKLLKSLDSSNATKDNVKIFLIPLSKLTETKENIVKNNSDRFWEAVDFKKYKDVDPKFERTISNSNTFKSNQKPVNNSRPSSNVYSNIPKPLNQNKPSILLHSIKTSLNSLINKPTVKPIKQNLIADKIIASSTYSPISSTTQNPIEFSDEYYNDSEEKTFLTSIKKQQMKDQNEVLKDGGIIIQRLKVRKGGIAIAGPGGIATAGSGGTAIVGPGGYALTHPKSLTIAGPGAKIIAYPSETDLKDVILNDDLIQNGKVVATGPAIYYNDNDS